MIAEHRIHCNGRKTVANKLEAKRQKYYYQVVRVS
jgi:hypothetical protein